MTPVVFIHGMWSTPKVWDNYKKIFETCGFPVHTPRLRHHTQQCGKLEALGKTSLLDYADDLEQYIRKLDTAPILVGHSMGGLLAQILASRGVVKGVILLAPAPPAGISLFHHSIARILIRIFLMWGFWNKPILLEYNKAKWGIFNNMNECDARVHYADFVHESGRALFEIGFWYLDSNKAANVNTANITCPILIVSGKADRLTPNFIVKRTAKLYENTPNYKFEEYSGYGHWLLGEPGWEKIAKTCVEWLKDNDM